MRRWNPEILALARRLLIAAGIIVLIVLATWGLNRAGVWVPWWVPVLAFAVIVIAALARAREAMADEVDESNDIAGRIKPD
jgi:CHASE2 domain-containing sensor protein